MLVVSLVLVAVFVGGMFYRRTQKSGRELELMRIRRQLASMSRLRQESDQERLAPAAVEVPRP